MKEDTGEKEGEGRAFRLLSLALTIYTPSFLIAVGMGMTIPVLPLFAKQLGAALGVTGVVVALKGLGNVLFDLPSGLLVSRLGRRTLMLASSAVSAIMAVGAGLSPSVGVLAAMVFFGGIGESSWMLSRLAYLKDAVPSGKRGRALSLVGGVMRIGVFIGPILGGFLGERFGMRAAFYGQGALSLLAFLLVALKVESGQTKLDGRSSALGRVRETVSVHRESFLRYGSVIFALSLLRSGRQILFPLWGDHIALDLSSIGLVFGLASAVDMTLFYPAGTIMDRFGRKWAAAPCMILLSASLALLPLTRSFSTMLLVSLLGGVGNGLGSGIVITMGSDLAPRHRVGEFLGVWRLIADVGKTSAPFVIGFIAQFVTLGLSSVISAGLGAVGVWILIFLAGETRPRKPPVS
jgi:MFS family permease